jgi:SAM-dependent methyltransferase
MLFDNLQTAYGPASVETVNSRHWSSSKLARRRAERRLRAAEIGLLRRYERPLSGHVLELGSAGGRLTESLIRGARTMVGLGPSTPSINRCTLMHPRGSFRHGDLRDLDAFEDGQFDAVVAGHAAIDVFGHHQRRLLIESLRRVLAIDGVLIFSSHNLGSESLVVPPSRNLSANPFRLANRVARLPRALRNRAHLAHLQEREPGYAILNDASHDYALLHYYVSRDGQERQLADAGLRLLECVDENDAPVAAGEFAFGSLELHYAAEPAGSFFA